jgi:ubiquinone/menaquinone biosynthesis C-methylase UbiE
MKLTDYQQTTSKLYGKLFTDYSEKQFDDSVELFLIRHKKWGIDLNWFNDKVCLDAGCGGGRFVVALARLGAKKVYGIDISSASVEAACRRANDRGLTNTEIIEGSVLALPFPDNFFDYVVCSGVIHHTHEPYRAFRELVRVLKPGGKLFLSVYGKGGLEWLTNDFFRYTICKLIPFKTMDKLWALVGVPANKRYAYIDDLYVPYCFKFTESQIRSWLAENGFENVRRVKFERYDYEKLWSRLMHGVGWIQMYADKKII